MTTQSTTGEHPKQEPGDLRSRLVLGVAAGAIAMVLLVSWVAYLLTRANPDSGHASVSTSQVRTSYLTSNPNEDAARFQQEKRARLETYGRADGQGFAHIPIEQAMRKLASAEAARGDTQ